jgi:restriction endonuclease S subunit
MVCTMELRKISDIQSGYLSRGSLKASEGGSHFILQARDIDADKLSYTSESLARITPALSSKDWLLQRGDIIFMARGARNYSVLIDDIPDNTIAAACFFIIRPDRGKALAAYLCWYLNQSPVREYLLRNSGRGVHMPVVRRQVLEHIEIPVPALETQEKIIALAAHAREQQQLYETLAAKRKQFVTEACLQAIQKDTTVR